MKEYLTQAIQDYLKTIYDICESDGCAATSVLAGRMGISPASVTGMLQRLASGNSPLVDYRKHQGVTLTPLGKRAALEVIRHHRLIETYLVETLGYTWDEVHAEADKLEHVISEGFEARIAAVLGNPTRDPHGELIPNADLTMPTDLTVPLSGLRPPQTALIVRVRANDPALLRHLETLGLLPDAKINALEYSAFDHNLRLQVNGNEPIVVGLAISNNIFIDIL